MPLLVEAWVLVVVVEHHRAGEDGSTTPTDNAGDGGDGSPNVYAYGTSVVYAGGGGGGTNIVGQHGLGGSGGGGTAAINSSNVEIMELLALVVVEVVVGIMAILMVDQVDRCCCSSL